MKEDKEQRTKSSSNPPTLYTVKKDKTESEIMAHMRGLNSISERNDTNE